MGDADQLAALLHEDQCDVLCPEGGHMRYRYWERFAARLAAAGVTVASQPAPDALRAAENRLDAQMRREHLNHRDREACDGCRALADVDAALRPQRENRMITDRLAASVAALNEFFGDPTFHLTNWRNAAMTDLFADPPVFSAHPSAILALLDVVDAAMARVVSDADAAHGVTVGLDVKRTVEAFAALAAPIRSRHGVLHRCLWGNDEDAIYEPGDKCDAIRALDAYEAIARAYAATTQPARPDEYESALETLEPWRYPAATPQPAEEGD